MWSLWVFPVSWKDQGRKRDMFKRRGRKKGSGQDGWAKYVCVWQLTQHQQRWHLLPMQSCSLFPDSRKNSVFRDSYEAASVHRAMQIQTASGQHCGQLSWGFPITLQIKSRPSNSQCKDSLNNKDSQFFPSRYSWRCCSVGLVTSISL